MVTIGNTVATEDLEILIGQVIHVGDYLGLPGDFGSGKTTLTKGIARGGAYGI